jgi:carboxymethylenebutenolidase
MTRIEIATPDGICPSYVYRPRDAEHPAPWPAVLVFMDGVGIRPEMLEIGETLAKHGYFALVPDLYHRAGPYAPMNARELFTDPEKQKMLREKFFAVANQALVMSDARVFLEWISTQRDVKAGGIGTTGYCMGGRMSLVAAGTFPDRIVAAGAFHPGRVVTDAPDTPHLIAAKAKARVYVAGAIEDASFTDDDKKKLEAALTEGGVDHVMETYPAKHGWVFRDIPTYDAACAERHWKATLALFDAKLKG